MNTINGNVFIYGLEAVIETFLTDHNPRGSFQGWLTNWLKWEKDSDSNLVLIGADVGKGIVPLEKHKRLYRDVVGWCYQDVVKKSDRVDLIWYGINQQLK
ncbi:bifunctional adenosylcobinamide kinase/adenosylcobinamide-phosphate guanylyltransferase [Halalkalibacter akibai]|uniref:Uncharacterized protein n=1 Tax=Halalkalibacter akibai (strain ATCC 43226 / DSM 21942 / CIP 109018 / JCM 9157 / 1139) TaxID=1236973 RepID=W4QUV5_HALA3|nr:bifunctional adenosylcobinamide kinase/adenosylcobinamide-phosphate guanylyltransferase [Halalkalibacter akibai]GAE35876.1 hypothetical protein JCM9157_3013 [Halalkalibacter akibai JCM 9157]